MDIQSTHLVTEATERLFRMAQPLAEPEDKVRFCERLLQALWRQLAAVSGPDSATALVSRAVLEASSMWPMLQQIEVTNGWVDASALRQAHDPAQCGVANEACRAVVRNFLGLIATLWAEDLTVALVERVE